MVIRGTMARLGITKKSLGEQVEKRKKKGKQGRRKRKRRRRKKGNEERQG